MKKFMETNKVTYNLMSFSGFKAILLFSYLLEGPKSYEDIQKYLLNNEYLHESVSIDTIRIYINSLKKIGCNVIKKVNNKNTYFYIKEHPFMLKISDEQINSIIKIVKALISNIDLSDFLALQSFIEKISIYILNKDLKAQVQNISPIKDINGDLLKDLINYVKDNAKINVRYNSPNSGEKDIIILADKLFISNEKLYLSGLNSIYNNYGNLLVENIIKINGLYTGDIKFKPQEMTVIYELYKYDNKVFQPSENERIIKENKDKILVEIKSKNKFFITQKILSYANKCKIISPKEYQNEIISYLKQMKEGYLDKE